MGDNTIFDDTFRTMVEKMPQLVIPLLNEAFDTSYSEELQIDQLRNEHHDPKTGEVVTDSCLRIGLVLYHVECQSTDDTTMVIRMIEYDFRIALEYAQKEGRRYRIRFPRSCVLYLRDTAATPDWLEADVEFFDGETFVYHFPAIKMSRYTKDALFEKRLLMLLPFYVIRYEEQTENLKKDSEKLKQLLEEFSDIRDRLDQEPDAQNRPGMYMDLKNLIVKISDYIFREEETVREGIGKIMGGKTFELESERLLRIGHEDGFRQGRKDGRTEGEEIMGKLVNALIKDKRFDDISLATSNSEIRNRLYAHYGILQSEEEPVS